MKNLLSIALVCLSMVSLAQNKSVFQQVVDDCKTSKRMVMKIDSDLFDLYLKKETSKTKKAMAQVLKGVDNLNVFRFREKRQKRQAEHIQHIKNLYEKANWLLFKENNNSYENNCIMLKKKDKQISGIAYIGSQFNNIVLLEFLGKDIQLKKIAKLSGLMNLQGAERLSELTGGKKEKSFLIHSNRGYIGVRPRSFEKNPQIPLFIYNGKELSPYDLGIVSQNKNKSITILKGNVATKRFGTKAKNGAVIIDTKMDTAMLNLYNKIREQYLKKSKKYKHMMKLINGETKADTTKQFLFVVDGKIVDSKDFDKVSPDDIETTTILRGEDAKKYSKKGYNKVIVITTHKK